MFDITTLAASETSTVDLVDGNDEPLTDDKGKRLSITVYGPGSAEYEAAERRKNAALTARMMKKGKASVVNTPEELAEFYAACTVSFNGFTYPAEDKAEGFAMFRAAYLDAKIGFIRDQVAEHIRDWANFTKRSATS